MYFWESLETTREEGTNVMNIPKAEMSKSVETFKVKMDISERLADACSICQYVYIASSALLMAKGIKLDYNHWV